MVESGLEVVFQKGLEPNGVPNAGLGSDLGIVGLVLHPKRFDVDSPFQVKLGSLCLSHCQLFEQYP